MEIELAAADVTTVHRPDDGYWVDLLIEPGTTVRLTGSEGEVVELLGRIADTFNAEVAYRNPGPLQWESGEVPDLEHYFRMAGLIGADGKLVK